MAFCLGKLTNLHEEAHSMDDACTIGQRSFSRVCAARRLVSITTLPVRTFCGMLKRGLGEGDNRRLSNGEQINRLAALSLKRGKSVDFGGYWQRHSKDVHA
jgi:hypothetical protein